MTVAFINPNLVVLSADPFTTGIIYMPVGLASTVAALRTAGFPVSVIDAFGEKPRQGAKNGKYLVLGLTPDEVILRLTPDIEAICLYANQLINHLSVTAILKALKLSRPALPVIILENTQAVTAYELRSVASELFAQGADWILNGEAEERLPDLLAKIQNGDINSLRGLPGIMRQDFATPPAAQISNLDKLPFPAWELFPLENYWSLRFGHGPQSSSRYLPVLTSRGCPYPCRFCVVPATNQRKWRSLSPKRVVDEIEYLKRRFSVSEFHFEDLNSTVNDKRTRGLCEELIARKLDIKWKLVAGTKVETIRDEQTVELMARAGCKYISISPESGSPRVLKLINKPFDVPHAIKMVHSMNAFGIRSQACFVLGFPGENDEDREMSRGLVKSLAKEGIDEIALFIISPVPGSAVFDEFKGYQSLSDLNFTPSWREDYDKLKHFRLKLYLSFICWKFLYHPKKIFRQCANFLSRRFETKMEMVPYKAMIWKSIERRAA